MSTFTVTVISVLLFCYFNSVFSGRIKRVINGVEVPCGSQSHIASLRKSSSGQHLCGATLLSPHFALTAAHCIAHRGSPAEYRLHLNNLCGPSMPVYASVEEIIVHDNYDRLVIAHDIALVRVILATHDTAGLNFAVLPTSTFGLSGECTTYGYGNRERGVKTTSGKLLAGPMWVVSLDKCKEALGPNVAPKTDGGMLCAMGDGVDACEGDSGGPLICKGVIEAISSYGMDCAIPGRPGVFTSVAAHLKWIKKTMAKLYMYNSGP